MKKDKTKSKIVLIFLVLFFCLFCALIFITNNMEKKQEEELKQIALAKKPQNAEEVMKKYNITQSKKEINKYYVDFEKPLYEDDGRSNEKYFEDIVKDMDEFYDKNPYYIIDDEKAIEIYSSYDYENEERYFTINDIEDFFENTNGDSFVNVETSKIVSGTRMATDNLFLDKLTAYNGYISHIEEDIGEGEIEPYGYKSYLDGQIKIKVAPTGTVRNIIFTKDYHGDITYTLDTDMTLREVSEKESKFDFGGLNYGYIGYRTSNYYLFFYGDEVSAYTYAYRSNYDFEDILEEYITNKNLSDFVEKLKKKFKAYDDYTFNYEPENGNLYMNYATRGIEIDIKENNPKGITLYSNYYFTDYTKKLVKNGIVSFDGKTDAVEKYELERREKIN